MSKPLHDSPFAALSAEGDIDFHKGARRSDNPHQPGTRAHELWHVKWDAAAFEAGQILRASAAIIRHAGSIRAAIANAAKVWADMRAKPKLIPVWSERPREAEVQLRAALAHFPTQPKNSNEG